MQAYINVRRYAYMYEQTHIGPKFHDCDQPEGHINGFFPLINVKTAIYTKGSSKIALPISKYANVKMITRRILKVNARLAKAETTFYPH